MLDIKFYSNKYRRFRYNLKDFIIDERRPNYPIERKNIGLSVLKGYSLLYNYQKRNEENGKRGPIGVRLLYYL